MYTALFFKFDPLPMTLTFSGIILLLYPAMYEQNPLDGSTVIVHTCLDLHMYYSVKYGQDLLDGSSVIFHTRWVFFNSDLVTYDLDLQ